MKPTPRLISFSSVRSYHFFILTKISCNTILKLVRASLSESVVYLRNAQSTLTLILFLEKGEALERMLFLGKREVMEKMFYLEKGRG